MHQSRRSRRREESPRAAAEFCRRTPAQDQLRSRKQSNASKAATGSTYVNGFSAEGDCIALDIRQSSSKTSDGISIKELIEEEASTLKESRHSSPGLIARLMGLDTFPSLVKQRKLQGKNVDSCSKTLSVDPSRKYGQTEDFSQWSKNEKEEFKDVFVVTEASKGKKHNYHSDTRGRPRIREEETDKSISRQNFTDTKCFSHDEVLQNSKAFNGALRCSTKDLFLELLEDRNSLFAKHLQDLKQEPYSPHRSMITILKPRKKGTNLRSPSAERNFDKCSHVQQKVIGSFRTHAKRLSEVHVEENSGCLSRSSLASPPYARRHETHVQPSHIVILKPTLEKPQKMTETNLFSDDKFWFGSKKDRVAPTVQELNAEGRNKQNFSHLMEVLNNNVNGSQEIAREIRRKMRHNLRSLKKRNLIVGMDKCPGTRDSFIMPGNAYKLIHPDEISQFPDSSCEWSDNFIPSPSYSNESFFRSETQRLSSERKNITRHFEDVGLISGGSSTQDQMHTLSERETPGFTMDMLNLKNTSVEHFASNEVRGSKDSHLGINRKDPHRDRCSRFSKRSKSPAASQRPKLGDGGCYITMLEDIPDMGPSVSSGAAFSMPVPLTKSSNHQNHKFQLANSVEEYILPEREIHVNSDGLRKNIHTKDFAANTGLHPAPTDPSTTDRYQLTNSALFPILGDEARHLATQEEQRVQSGFPFPTDNLVVQEKLNDGIQVKLLLSESDMEKFQCLSSKDLEHSSPVSVLETPPEDEPYNSGCFERLSSDLKELRIQLERLKQESAATHLEENEILMLNDAEFAGSGCTLLPPEELRQGLTEDDHRDFTYLVNVLVESGIHGIEDSKLVNACYSQDRCRPIDQNVFSKLEKRYNAIASWSRSERKLLFDLINCSLEGSITSCMDVHSRIESKLGMPARDHGRFVEALWQMVAKQRKELQCNENKVREPEWFVWEHDIDSVRVEMEKMVSDDLLEELVSDLLL